MVRFVIAVAISVAMFSGASAQSLRDHDINLGEPHGIQRAAVSCRWEKTLVVRLYKEGAPGAILYCASGGPRVVIKSARH